MAEQLLTPRSWYPGLWAPLMGVRSADFWTVSSGSVPAGQGSLQLGSRGVQYRLWVAVLSGEQ